MSLIFSSVVFPETNTFPTKPFSLGKWEVSKGRICLGSSFVYILSLGKVLRVV